MLQLFMADAPLLPHDRGHELWTMEDGASRKLIGSIDRWVSAMVGDDSAYLITKDNH